MTRWLHAVLVPLVAFGLATSDLHAQSRATTADVTGVVVDQSGAVLPGVAVTATNQDTGVVRAVFTEGDGSFALQALAVGRYTVRAELDGFNPTELRDVTLALGATVSLTVPLDVAGTAEQVTVVAEVPGIDVQKTVVSTVVSKEQIETLPINGRNFISFSVITPGVSTDQTPQQGASGTSGLTFAGQRARSNNITVDGLDNNDIVVGAVRATFSQEAVREFQVLTNSYSAEFGKASGGVVNIVTKSGTNTFAGNVFGFFRDESLNAKNHFEQFSPAGAALDRSKAPYSQKQFGGTVGGPIVKDRTFFFASFERLDIAASNFVTIDDETPIRHPVLSSVILGTPASILRRAGFPVDTGNVPYDVRSSQFLAKVDHQLGDGQSVAFRLNAADDVNENIEPFGGQVARSRAAVLDSRDLMFAASHTAVIGSKSVNEFRFQVANRNQDVNSLDPTCDGPCDQLDEGGPTLEVTGFASVGRQRFTPQPRRNTRYQLLNTFSYFSGRHSLKGGIDYSFIDHTEQALPLHFGGRYIFFQSISLPLVPGLPVLFPVSSIQAVALGLPTAYVQGYGNQSSPYTYSDVSLFVQDDWQIADNLTAKIGLRYQNQFWPEFDYGVAGFPNRYGFPADNNNVAPRLSLAWDPTGRHRTSVHGSYGIFYDNLITGVAGITDLIDGENNVRTLVLPAPRAFAAWAAPGHRLPEATAQALAGGAFPSTEISIDPGYETPYAHHVAVGVDHQMANEMTLSANVVYVRGFNQLGTIDYNPVVAALGAIPGVGFVRRPEDVNGRPGTSASILQYTSYGETWYKGLTVSLSKRFSDRYQFLASYTLSEAEDNSTDFQSAFIPQNNGAGRNPDDLTGLPVGFDADLERGPSLQDQRHRLVLSGLYLAPWDVQIAAIVTAASGRPYNVLAGADLNFDGNGGAFPADRARRDPASEASSVGRNSETMPTQATVDLRLSKRFVLGGRVSVDGIFEVFNLFDRTNFTDVQNIFGSGSYPDNPIPTFGQFTQAGAPRQIQLALKLNF